MVCNNTKCPNPVSGAWAPKLLGFSSDTGAMNGTCSAVLRLGFNETLHKNYGSPATVMAEYMIDPARKRINVTLTWYNKTATPRLALSTRLPEALTVFVTPSLRPHHRWEIDKLGEWVSPA
eukprot:gene20529-biopygen111331